MSFSDNFTIEAAPLVSPKNFASENPIDSAPVTDSQEPEDSDAHNPLLPPLNPESFQPLAELQAIKTPETPFVKSPNELEVILDPDEIRLQLGL